MRFRAPLLVLGLFGVALPLLGVSGAAVQAPTRPAAAVLAGAEHDLSFARSRKKP
jgi:hypothetical protein